ncbi:MAG: cytochrome P450 [Acidimicrobiia bacterium]|nr:cytochrome P450 [Acidimicrobiia bacterium]
MIDSAHSPSATPVPVDQLELPTLPDLEEVNDEEYGAIVMEIANTSWLAKNPIGYTALRYDDVVAILRDRRWHSLASRLNELRGIPEEMSGESILSAEGDVHTRLRRLVAKSFSPSAADRLRPFMREVIGELIDDVASSGRADIVADICESYPIPIICELLGAPREDWQKFSKWADEVLGILDADAIDKLDVIRAAGDELREYTLALIAQRRDDPRDDLLSELIAAEEEGDRLSNDELVTMVNAVILAGTDTTRNQLACSIAVLAEQPEQWAALAHDPESVPQAVEELMRYLSTVRGTGRFASEDIVYRDVLFPAGTPMMIALASANRDERVFPDPHDLDLMKAPSAHPQLGFGSGIHYCLGAALARAELQEALPLLASRLPGLTLAAPVTWKLRTAAIFGPQELHVTFDPGH